LNVRVCHVPRELFPPIDSMTAARVAAAPLPPRQRLYGIGPGKSGTHALASLFTGIAAAHEPETDPLIGTVLDHVSGRCGWEAIDALARDRDARLGLVVDVSNINIFLVDLLVRIAPDARFVLTIRDPYSWLDSLLNHYLRVTPTAAWRAFADYRFRPDDFPHPPAERILEHSGLYPLAGYLGYWNAHLSKAIEAVPPDRLLIVRTNDIAARASEIASFAGLDEGTVDSSRIDEFRNPHKSRIIEEIPSEHVQEQVERHCGPLMRRFFPEIRSPTDAGLERSMRRQRVFGIGWAKTGVTTLGRCLRELGYRHHGQRLDLVKDLGSGDLATADLSRILAAAAVHEAFTDWPWILLYRQLDEAFPGSRFVLTTREPGRWLRSYRSMIARLPPATPEVVARRRILYGLPFPDVTDAMLLERRARHDAAVRDWFRGRPESLLTVDWESGGGWNELCGFLRLPVPAVPFPHENRAESHPRIDLARAIR
jgi:hypothetical protein